MPTIAMTGIKGSGAYFPKQKIEVRELAHKYHLNYHNLLKDHNVKSLHVANQDETELFMATKAVQDALKDARVDPGKIDLIIFCKGIGRHKSARPIASQIIQSIKAEKAYGFDIEAGLIGGLLGLQVASDIIKNNYYINNAVIVAAQEFDELYLFGGEASRLKHLIFGDGSAAVVLSKNSENNNILASDFFIDHNTSLIDEMLTESVQHQHLFSKLFSKMKSGPVIGKIRKTKNVTQLTETWAQNSFKVIDSCIRSINLDISDINHFIKTHLSVREAELLAEMLKIKVSDIHNASHEVGHLGPADIIYNLHYTLRNEELKNLDVIALVTANYDCSSGAIIMRR